MAPADGDLGVIDKMLLLIDQCLRSNLECKGTIGPVGFKQLEIRVTAVFKTIGGFDKHDNVIHSNRSRQRITISDVIEVDSWEILRAK